MAEQTGSVLQPEGNRGKEKKNARDNLRHAAEFTFIENTAGIGFLRGWIPEANRQDDEIIKAADDVWALTVLYEHFVSELNSDPSSRTRESRAVLKELADRAQAAQDRLAELTPTDDDTNDDLRINELVRRTVEEVIHKLGLS